MLALGPFCQWRGLCIQCEEREECGSDSFDSPIRCCKQKSEVIRCQRYRASIKNGGKLGKVSKS